MPRTVEYERLKKHTLLLYEGDFDKLASYFPTLGGSVAIRRIVRSYIEKIDHTVPPQNIEIKGDLNV